MDTLNPCDHGSMSEPSDTDGVTKKQAATRKPYQNPTLKQMTNEEARLKLVRHADNGHEGAEELLQLGKKKCVHQTNQDHRKSA